MILFIAESFSERQHLVSVRPCFHPIQQLDRALQHKEINQFAKVTQRVSDSFQIRPQESLAPWMPRTSHMTSREFNTFYRLQVDAVVLIFYSCLYFQGLKELVFLIFLQWAHQIATWFPVNAQIPCPPQLGVIRLGWVCSWQGKSEPVTQCSTHTGTGKVAIQRLANSEPRSWALCSGHCKCASRRHRKSWGRRGNVPGEQCHELLLLVECYFSQNPG